MEKEEPQTETETDTETAVPCKRNAPAPFVLTLSLPLPYNHTLSLALPFNAHHQHQPRNPHSNLDPDQTMAEITAHDEEAQQQQRPLLKDKQVSSPAQGAAPSNPVQRAIDQTFKSTAHLANLLPTGTVLTFQLLAPVFTGPGECDQSARFLTAVLVVGCALSCYVLCFTDSFRTSNGRICYGVATKNGLWVIDGTVSEASDGGKEYKLRFVDFVHAFGSVLVFMTIALLNEDIVRCFYPSPSKEMAEMLTRVPVGIGVLCSMLFVAFPTKRHGIGFPLSSN